MKQNVSQRTGPPQQNEDAKTTIASYMFDSINKMISGKNANEVASYTYNGFGHLVGKESPDAKQFVLDYTMQIPVNLTENDIKYVYGLERVSQTNGGSTLLYHNDRLGSAEKLTDLSGNVTASVRYDEWGKPSIIIPGLNPNYTGHEYDKVLGIYYARARFYDYAHEFMHDNINIWSTHISPHVIR